MTANKQASGNSRLRLHASEARGATATDESAVFRFENGLPAFPEAHRFVLRYDPDLDPFMVLDCLDVPALSFYCIDPFLVYPGYVVVVPRVEQERLGLADSAAALVISLVTVAPDPREFTANLLAPIVINLQSLQARQVILDQYPVRYRIWAGIEAMQAAGEDPRSHREQAVTPAQPEE